MLYNRLRENPNLPVVPRTFFFAGKAAPTYHLAKVIIKFINNLAAAKPAPQELLIGVAAANYDRVGLCLAVSAQHRKNQSR